MPTAQVSSRSRFWLVGLGGILATLVGPAGVLLPVLPLLVAANWVAVFAFHTALVPTASSLWELWLLLAVMSIPGSLVVGGVLTALVDNEHRQHATWREMRETGRFWGLLLGVMVWPVTLMFTFPVLEHLLDGRWSAQRPGLVMLVQFALVAGITGAALGEIVSRWLGRHPA